MSAEIVPTKRVTKHAVQVRFHDENFDRYVWTKSDGGCGGLMGTAPYVTSTCAWRDPADPACQRLLKDSVSQWGREAMVTVVEVDLTMSYVRKLEDTRLHVKELEEMLGVTP